MRITVLAVGRIKEKFFTGAVEEYSKRLGRYCKLEVIEVADESTPDHASEKEREKILQKEGQRLLKYMRDDAYMIALAIHAKQMSSESFADMIGELGLAGKSHIIFVIGGSLGLSQEVLSRADRQLSFSEMTFPHQLMRVVLLEQIYRAYRILQGEPYHK